MSNRDPMLNEYRVLKKALSGALPLHASFGNGYHGTTDPDIGIEGQSIAEHLKRMSERGMIVGWVPILTEKGKARWDALRAIYDGDGP